MKNAPPELPTELVAVVGRQCAATVPRAYQAIPREIQESYGDALLGILFYGSCLKDEDLENNVADIYVIVDDYKKIYQKPYLAYLNAWLPPNVFYREIPGSNGLIRIKSAVISLADFNNGVLNWFHSYLWGRFSQPARILYARDEKVRHELHATLAQAALTLLKTTTPTLEDELNSVEAIWTKALSLSYAAEYRPESKSRAGRLARSGLDDYARLTDAALPGLDGLLRRHDETGYLRRCDDAARKKALFLWSLRRRQGRILSVLRLMKAALTFESGVDYAAWKIRRHTGVAVEITPELRRHPLLFGWRVFRRLVKRDVLR